MAVTAREFDAWLKRRSLPTSSAEIAQHLNRPASTIKTQRFRSRISEEVIVSLARSFNLAPLDALTEFEPYQALAQLQLPPTTTELVSQLTHTDLLAELLRRGSAHMARIIEGEYTLSPIPHADGVRAWIDAIDPGNVRAELSDRTGIATTNLSTLLSENRLSPDLAMLASSLAEVSQISGLVVTGLLTPEEGNWPPMGRVNALKDLGDLELIDLTDVRLKGLRRRVKKNIETHQTAEALWKAIG